MEGEVCNMLGRFQWRRAFGDRDTVGEIYCSCSGFLRSRGEGGTGPGTVLVDGEGQGGR